MLIENPLPAAKRPSQRQGLLARLRDDTRGNTLAIVGAALIPLTAMIGSGVDMSRAYMAKTRLQSACDAASLAGRRVMQNDTLNQTVTDEATRFFRFNFPDRLYDTATFTPQVTRPAAGTVRVAANTTIPTTVMGMFGFTNLPLSVSCDATLNFVNTDVMLVMDVTGSMANEIGGEPKIVSMRDAVMALYDELAPIQTQLEANSLRLRYGVVPYSTTVNVGELIRGVNANFLANDAEYETRVAVYETPVDYTVTGPPSAPVQQIASGSLTQSECDLYGRNRIQIGDAYNPDPEWVRTYSNNEAAGQDWGWSGSGDTSGSRRACRRRYVQFNADVETWGFTVWSYESENVNTTNYKTGAVVEIATDNPSLPQPYSGPGGTVTDPGRWDVEELAAEGTDVYKVNSATWTGCIQERDTLNTITSATGYTIPTGAWDLNINYVPDNEATRWRPMWRSLAYRRTAGTQARDTGELMTSAACPAAARRLAATTRGDMQSYVNALQPTGNTYHDSGMIWGARMISNAGVFADSPDTFAGMPVSRHIIFMSDGQMEPDQDIYAMYGIEQNSQRIAGMNNPGSGQGSELAARHNHRFRMICNAAKSMNVSIWVIAFGTTLSSDMLECASNANQASTAANRAALIARFRQIGSQIGALRLTQ